jgi:hypothetical protein
VCGESAVTFPLRIAVTGDNREKRGEVRSMRLRSDTLRYAGGILTEDLQEYARIVRNLWRHILQWVVGHIQILQGSAPN